MDGLWRVLAGAALAVVTAWALLAALLLIASPSRSTLREALRLLPDTVRLVHRLAGDPALGRGARTAVWLLLAWLAMPFDLVPDVIPVLGWADDVIVALLVLRWVARRAGRDVLARHWPGSADGLAALERACRIA